MFKKISIFIIVLLIIAIPVSAQQNLPYSTKTEFGKEYRILKQTKTYSVRDEVDVLTI